MKMLVAQKTLLLLCVGVSLAQDSNTAEKLKNIEERLRVTEETLEELKKENQGTFTAPVNGVYFFRFYVHAHTPNQMAVSLHKNDQLQCSVYSLKPESNANGSNGVVLSLQKGDEVYTQLWENSWVFDDGNSYTSFSGFLLFPV
ncbi:Complement C1q-like protein 4 [Labeo rohita]|uniref:Complement C1q-like protein 4 n=1 Tax=Labeo rohita TaxID=84645 RepID=A0ABQ8MYE7_LABRO|nr:Complement C1q-like protein 4 [Labeo rohita]